MKDQLINLHQTDVAKYDFFSSTTKGTFWNWVEQEFPIQVKFYGNHFNIEYFQTIITGEVYFHTVTVLCCGLRGYALRTTARQYGEVVIPDASTGQILVLKPRNSHGARRVWRVFLCKNTRHTLLAP